MVRAHLERLLHSPVLADSGRLRSLLSYLVQQVLQGRTAGIKEAVVAVEVFGRTGGYDPRTDSVVRVQALNLRHKLDQYYAAEGREDPVRIRLPKGGYIPEFQFLLTSSPPASGSARRSRRALLAGVTILLAAALLAAGWFRRRQAAGPAAEGPSVAVLPFVNLAGGTDNEYFVDGLVEDLTTALAGLPELRVAARTSAFQFRGRSDDARAVGRKLGVGAILEGSVRRHGSRVKVTVQLISAATGFHLWSSGYERDIADVPLIEHDIRGAVARTLGLRQAVKPPSHAVPAEAREAYWRGRYLQGNWQRIRESIPFLEQAVSIDPRFAEAWAALASVHSTLAFHHAGPTEQEAARTKEAARRALELEEAMPEAHLALASLFWSHDHDWPASERAYRRALELNPSFAAAHRAYALALTPLGRFREAVAHLEQAQRLDPVTILTTNNMAATLYCARRFGEAAAVARRHVQMDPQFYPAWVSLGSCDAQLGRFGEAVASLEKAAALSQRDISVLGPLGHTLARSGHQAEARTVLAEILAARPASPAAGLEAAKVLAGLGEPAPALALLRQAATDHVTDVSFIGVDPVFDSLRTDREFHALCARLGIPAGPR